MSYLNPYLRVYFHHVLSTRERKEAIVLMKMVEFMERIGDVLLGYLLATVWHVEQQTLAMIAQTVEANVSMFWNAQQL